MTLKPRNPYRRNSAQQRREAYVSGLHVSDIEYRNSLLKAAVGAHESALRTLLDALDAADQLPQSDPIKAKLAVAYKADLTGLAEAIMHPTATEPVEEDGQGSPFDTISPPSDEPSA